MRPFRYPGFRYLWLALAASTLGDRVALVSLALYVSKIGRPHDVSFVLAAATGSLLLFLLVGGVWADRLARRRVMFASDMSRALLHGALAGLILAGVVQLWQIIAIEFAFGAAEAFFRPAHAGLLPQTVPAEQLHQAWAATALVQNLAELLGPILATALVLGLGPGLAFGVDGGLYLISAVLLVRARPLASRPANSQRRQGALRELREGWTALRSRTWAWTAVAVFGIGAPALYCPWLTLGPSVATKQYGHAGAFGAFLAAAGAGTLAGTLVSASWRPAHPLRIAHIALLPGLLAIPAFALGVSLWATIPFACVWGAGAAIYDVTWAATLAQRIPGHVLSRVTAFEWVGGQALMPVGLVLAGTLGEQFGAAPVLIVGVAIYALAAIVGLAVPETWRMGRWAPVTQNE